DNALAGTLTFSKSPEFAAARAIFDLRTRCGMTVELLSSAPGPEAERLADGLGVDAVHLCASDDAREAVIRRLNSSGRHAVYVGDCRQNPRAAAAAHVAVYLCPDPACEGDPSTVWLLRPNYEKIAQLRALATAMREEARRHCNLIMIPNVVCI